MAKKFRCRFVSCHYTVREKVKDKGCNIKGEGQEEAPRITGRTRILTIAAGKVGVKTLQERRYQRSTSQKT